MAAASPARRSRSATVIAAALLACIALYAVAGFVVIPELARQVLQRQVRAWWGATLHIERVHFDPFRLRAELTRLRLEDEAGKSIGTAAAVHARVRLAGLLRRSMVLGDLEFVRPHGVIVHHARGEPNLRRATGGDVVFPRVRVERVTVRDGSLALVDRGVAPAARIEVTGINFSAEGLPPSGAGAGRFRLTVADAAGARIAAAGHVQGPGLRARGRFAVEALALGDLSPWLAEPGGGFDGIARVHGSFVAESGRAIALEHVGGEIEGLRLSADDTAVRSRRLRFSLEAVRAAAGDPRRVEAGGIALQIEGLELEDAASRGLPATLDRVMLSEGRLRWPERSLQIGGIAIDGASFALLRTPQGRMRWPAGWARAGRWSAGWAYRLGALRGSDLELEILDAAAGGVTVRHRLSEVDLRLSDLASAADASADFSLRAIVDDGARLEARGRLIPAARSLRATVAIDELDVAAFAPYLDACSALVPRAGTLAAELELGYQDGLFRLRGSAGGRRLEFADGAHGGRAFGAQRMTVRGLEATGTPPRVSAETLVLDDAYVRLAIDGDGTANVSAWWRPEAAGCPAVSVRRMRIGGGVDLTDRVLSPALHLRFQDVVAGAVTRHRDGEAAIAVEFDGRVERGGALRLNAELRTADPLRSAQLQASAHDLDAALLSPYAARFAGRSIDSGRMHLTAHYRIDHGRLDARHELAFERLALGAPMASAGYPPLALAVALLEDAHGRIEVAVPVSGDLSDPAFDVRAALGEALAERIAGTARAPFEALRALVGAAGPLDQVPFPPGSAALGPAAQQVLDHLAEALHRRPRIALVVTGGFDPFLDRDALARQQLYLQISLAIAEGPPAGDAAPALDDPEVQEILEEFAGARLDPATVAAIAARFGTPAAAAQRTAYYDALLEALVANERIPDTALRRLARYRARAIADRLALLGAGEERVTVAGEAAAVRGTGGRVVARLQVQAAR